MSLMKSKFTLYSRNHVSVTKRNAFSLFLEVIRDMSIDCRLCERQFQAANDWLWRCVSPIVFNSNESISLIFVRIHQVLCSHSRL